MERVGRALNGKLESNVGRRRGDSRRGENFPDEVDGPTVLVDLHVDGDGNRKSAFAWQELETSPSQHHAVKSQYNDLHSFRKKPDY